MDISQAALDRWERSEARAKKAALLTVLGFLAGGLIGFIIAEAGGWPIDRVSAGGALAGFILMLWLGFGWAFLK